MHERQFHLYVEDVRLELHEQGICRHPSVHFEAAEAHVAVYAHRAENFLYLAAAKNGLINRRVPRGSQRDESQELNGDNTAIFKPTYRFTHDLYRQRLLKSKYTTCSCFLGGFFRFNANRERDLPNPPENDRIMKNTVSVMC